MLCKRGNHLKNVRNNSGIFACYLIRSADMLLRYDEKMRIRLRIYVIKRIAQIIFIYFF